EGPADAVPREDGSLARLVLERPKQADEPGPRRRRLETVGVEVRHVVPESRLHFPGVGAAPDLAAHGEWVERPGLIRGRAQGRRQLRDPSPRRVLFNRRARHEDDVGGRLLSLEAEWQGRRQVFLTRGRILVRNPGDRLEFVQDGLETTRTILSTIGCAYRRGTMSEIRKDYATPAWVVFSAARSQRPGAFRNTKDATPKADCPFCEGHEGMTPPEVLAYRDGGTADGPGWSIRCVPNKFPALERSGEVREHRDGLLVSVDGVGAHE